MPSTLRELEGSLRGLSHSEDAIRLVEGFSVELKHTKKRLEVFNSDQGLVRAPILQEDTQALGFAEPDDEFSMLQGDIVSTESAYYFGERVTGGPKYIVFELIVRSRPEETTMCCAVARDRNS